ncbi:hypothetical protein [Streptomyces sp. G-G2]|uniref:hypothetical protein n=1 Tax=Streptomyces sp. G-G2 TaxID=3046201 RepID=UPI0024B8CC5E|nr:hypothetical protein [Streptomyces sp. G-G2]MDJ0379967.1 hypothetical protein [Streptomyces sp. G-G2]
MNPYARLATAAAEWDDLRPRLTPPTPRRLALLLASLRLATGEVAEQASLLAARLLGQQLPDRFPGEAGAAPAASAPDAGHLGFSADAARSRSRTSPSTGPTMPWPSSTRTAAPSVGDAEALEGGCDPHAPWLIRLRGAGGCVRLPAFPLATDGPGRARARHQPVTAPSGVALFVANWVRYSSS